MYEYIKGGLANKYVDKKGYFVVIDVNGVGYLIEVMKKDYDKININQSSLILYTVLLHREDNMSLCGFLDIEVRNLFNILVKVSGVGVRMALNILNQFELKHLINCVVQEKDKELTKAKGIGIKLAQKIILELRDKFINVELEQNEKLGQRKLMKEKERLSKISPNYNSSGIQNYFDSNFNQNNFNRRKIVNDDIFGTSNNNLNNNNTNNFNMKKNKNKNLDNNENKSGNINEIFNLNKTKRSLEDINREIYEIESEMQSPGLQPHIKANLKKKFISLIRERSNLDKKQLY